MPTVFVTGATGYIGGRLVPRLLERGYRVRALSRSARKLAARPWGGHPGLEIVEGDAADEVLLARAMAGSRAAYYLVHSMMAAGSEYAARDRRLAEAFGRAAAAAGVARIVYLGGLGETGDELSAHLRSRREVEEALRAGGVPVTVLRAAMIVGSGSASFEILRYLVERLPVMVTPRWVSTPCQPIAVENVLHYLVACLEEPATVGETLDVGGADVLSYRELMALTAEALGLHRRLVVPVPLLTPRLSSLWIHLVTPLSHRIARPLAEGLRNPVVCRDDRAARLMPQRLLSAREAIGAAVDAARTGRAETRWSDAGPVPGDPDWAGGTVFVDRREVHLRTGPAAVWRAACRLGGERGWGAADPLWRLRGALDRLVGGPGLRRGRRDPERLAYGDALDFWRVTAVERSRRLELRAEMRLPGEAVLEIAVEPSELLYGGTRLVQTARFRPRGLLGLLYWAAVSPLHRFVFRSLLRAIGSGAEADAPAAASVAAADAGRIATVMADPTIDALLAALDRAYDKKSWHGTNLKGSIRGLPAETAAWRPAPDRHNVWEYAVHAAYWKYAVRRRITGEPRGSFPLEGSNWFERPEEGRATEAAWKADRKLLDEEHRRLREAVAGLTAKDLAKKAAGGETTILDLVTGAAAHDLYHAGQIQLLKRLAPS